MKKSLFTYLGLLSLIFWSCTNGGSYYKSHYPNKLKNVRSTQQEAKRNSNVSDPTAFHEHSNSPEVAETIPTKHFAQSHDSEFNDDLDLNTLPHERIILPVNYEILQNLPSDQFNTNSKLPFQNPPDCPTITDLTCQYLGDGVYMLSWTAPTTPVYNENGTLAEYRIIRRDVTNSKIYQYGSPEPECKDGTCTIKVSAGTDPSGFIWTVEARCNKTVYTPSNSVRCSPKNVVSENVEQDAYHSTSHNSYSKNRRTVNKKSLAAILIIPILMLAGIIAIHAMLLGGVPNFLMLIIILGCILVISLAILGIIEINAHRSKQQGIVLSILAIIAALFGLLIAAALLQN